MINKDFFYTEDENDILLYLVVEYGKGKCETFRELIDYTPDAPAFNAIPEGRRTVRFHPLLTPEQDKNIRDLAKKYGVSSTKIMRALFNNNRKVLVVRRRLEDDAAFRREFAKQVLRSKQ